MKTGRQQRRKTPRIGKRVTDRNADHGIGQPPEPFEEIIGMARPAPQSDVANPALVGGIGAERLELRIRQRLAGNAGQQDQRAEIVRRPQPVAGNARGDKDRECQRDRSEPLILQEDEHPPRRIGAPFPGEGRIAGIVRYPGGADRDVNPEPQRPDRDQRRHQPLPGIGRGTLDRPQGAPDADQAERKGPDGVDPAGIAGPLLHHPGARHQDRKRHGNRHQRLEI